MTTPSLHWISTASPPDAFPPVSSALHEPDGLLAAGGDLSEERLVYAYQHGIFPWYDSGQPILWWSPDPRCVLYPQNIHVSRTLRRSLRTSPLELTFNRAFDDVLDACAAPRRSQRGTWITAEMTQAYRLMHRRGWAHSVEVWRDDHLVGGIYGLAIGAVFFGESMFSSETNASKVAMAALCRTLVRCRFALLDCQVASAHLFTMGAELLPRTKFSALLARHCAARRFEEWPRERRKAADLDLPGNRKPA